MLIINNLLLLNHKVLNLDVGPGEVILIKGNNGAGKSLFLKTLSRLLPKKNGELIFENCDSSDYAIEKWRSKILYLSPEVIFSEDLSVDEYLAEPFKLNCYKDFKPHFNPRDFLPDLNSQMSLLSSGQKQRVAILRAMSLDAKVLLLDESFSHMDSEVRENILRHLKNWKGSDKILFIVSHFDIPSGHFDTRDFIF